ncbi:DNA-directed RNA polymerase I subunit RPA43 [Diretmus argenteus]
MANLEHAEEDESKHVKMPGEVSAVNGQVEPIGVSAVNTSAVLCSIPSFADASELLSAPYSCLVMNTHRRHIALSPLHLKKKRTGIQEELDAELLKYSKRLKGVPLAYDNIRILGQHGAIYDDNGYIHMDIEANFVIFKPKRGQRLLGKVNKLGVSHAGCLVHGCFNASIPKPNLVTVATWGSAGPRIGSELEFEVSALDADTVGVLLIRGRLDRTRVQELLAMGEISESSIPAGQPEQPDTELTPQPTQESPDDTATKKKKDKLTDVEQAGGVTHAPASQQDDNTTLERNGPTQDANGEEARGKKKKKKKEKHVKEEEKEVEVTPMEVHGSDSSGYLSDKPSKKRKQEPGSDVTAGLNNEPETPKSKKKRKSGVQQFA